MNEQEEDSSVERDGEEGKAPITISTHCFLFVGTSFVLSSRTIKTYAGLVGKNEPFRAEGKKGVKLEECEGKMPFCVYLIMPLFIPECARSFAKRRRGSFGPSDAN